MTNGLLNALHAIGACLTAWAVAAAVVYLLWLLTAAAADLIGAVS